MNRILLRKELWKLLCFKNYSFYEISTFGMTKNLKTQHILTGHKKSDGYMVMHLVDEFGNSIIESLHRLLAFAFILNIDDKPYLALPLSMRSTVDHLDRNRENNHVLNSRWTTHREQNENQDKLSTRNNGRVVCQYDLNDNLIRTWRCIKDTASYLNISDANISSCCSKI